MKELVWISSLFLFQILHGQVRYAPPPPPGGLEHCKLPNILDMEHNLRESYFRSITFNDVQFRECEGAIGGSTNEFLIIPPYLYRIHAKTEQAILVSYAMSHYYSKPRYEFLNIRNERIGNPIRAMYLPESCERVVSFVDSISEQIYEIRSYNGKVLKQFHGRTLVDASGEFLSVANDSLYDIFSTYKMDYVFKGSKFPVALSPNNRGEGMKEFFVSQGEKTVKINAFGMEIASFPYLMINTVWCNSKKPTSMGRNERLGFRVFLSREISMLMDMDLKRILVAPTPHEIIGKINNYVYVFEEDKYYGLVDSTGNIIVNADLRAVESVGYGVIRLAFRGGVSRYYDQKVNEIHPSIGTLHGSKITIPSAEYLIEEGFEDYDSLTFRFIPSSKIYNLYSLSAKELVKRYVKIMFFGDVIFLSEENSNESNVDIYDKNGLLFNSAVLDLKGDGSLNIRNNDLVQIISEGERFFINKQGKIIR